VVDTPAEAVRRQDIVVETEEDTYEVPDHGFTVNVVEREDGWWATWLQAGIGGRGETRTAALRALADQLDRADEWAAGLTAARGARVDGD
jgi:hypothetical protein